MQNLQAFLRAESLDAYTDIVDQLGLKSDDLVEFYHDLLEVMMSQEQVEQSFQLCLFRLIEVIPPVMFNHREYDDESMLSLTLRVVHHKAGVVWADIVRSVADKTRNPSASSVETLKHALIMGLGVMDLVPIIQLTTKQIVKSFDWIEWAFSFNLDETEYRYLNFYVNLSNKYKPQEKRWIRWYLRQSGQAACCPWTCSDKMPTELVRRPV